jgi:hypothetical protein
LTLLPALVPANQIPVQDKFKLVSKKCIKRPCRCQKTGGSKEKYDKKLKIRLKK